jgi:uncharacterized protein YegP (UPF0339 family)
MATETHAHGTAYDGWLFRVYTKYVTEPESKKDVYGYVLMVVGYLLAMGGMLIYIVGPSGSGADASTIFLVREVAAVPSATGLVFSLLGIVLLLPVRRISLAVAGLGAIVALAGVVLFVLHYPGNWYPATPNESGIVIGVYTAGIGVLAGVVLMVPVVTGERSYLSETTEGHEYDHPDIMIGESDRGGLFAVFKRGTEWTWRFIDQSAVAGSTSTFLSRLEAEERVDAVKDLVANAGLLEIKTAAFRLYEEREGGWEWSLVREDGNPIAEAGRSFDSRDDADATINAIKDHGPDAEVVVVDEPVYDTVRSEGEWGWRLVDEDRNPLAVAAETHAARDPAAAGIDDFRHLAAEASELVIERYGVELLAEDGAWSWRLRDSAHRELATSVDEYGSKGVAEDAVYDLLDEFQGATVLDARHPTYDVFRTGRGWEWRLVDENGDTVASGTDVADSGDAARAAAREMQSHAGAAEVVQIEDLEFETYRTGGGWAWRLVDGDRSVHAESTDTYESEEDAAQVVQRVRSEAPEADLIEFETAAFQVYEAPDGAWRWRLIDEDGAVLADSGQGEYESKDDAMSAMVTLQENAPDAEHLEIENAAFELFEDDRGWGWRLVDDIGETIADGATRHDSEEGARLAMDALVESVGDVGERRMANGIYQVYADADDEWWWQFVLPDGTVLAESPDSFGTRHEVEAAIEEQSAYADEAPVETIGQLAVRLDPADWSWSLVDEHREPVAESDLTYGSREAAVEAIQDLQDHAREVTVYEIRDAAFDCYRTDEGWTWRLVDDDHEPIAHSPRTVEDLSAVEGAIGTVTAHAAAAELADYDEVAFEVSMTDDGWVWQLVDDERRLLATAPAGFAAREDAERQLEAVRDVIDDASVIEIDSAAFEFHHTGEGWRWRLVDERGTEIGESVASFESRAEAQAELTTVKQHGPDAWVSVAE